MEEWGTRTFVYLSSLEFEQAQLCFTNIFTNTNMQVLCFFMSSVLTLPPLASLQGSPKAQKPPVTCLTPRPLAFILAPQPASFYNIPPQRQSHDKFKTLGVSYYTSMNIIKFPINSNFVYLKRQ